MFRKSNTPLQITVPHYREPISGIVTTAMALGALVQYKSTGAVGDPAELVAANGGAPAILENQVMSDADWQNHCKLDPQWNPELRKPVPVGSAVSARFAHEVEIEGTTLFHDIDANTAAGTPLKTEAGQFAIASVAIPDGGGTPDRVVGHLVRKVTPFDSTSFRWVIELVG
jgi:hypothetical protein